MEWRRASLAVVAGLAGAAALLSIVEPEAGRELAPRLAFPAAAWLFLVAPLERGWRDRVGPAVGVALAAARLFWPALGLAVAAVGVALATRRPRAALALSALAVLALLLPAPAALTVAWGLVALAAWVERRAEPPAPRPEEPEDPAWGRATRLAAMVALGVLYAALGGMVVGSRVVPVLLWTTLAVAYVAALLAGVLLRRRRDGAWLLGAGLGFPVLLVMMANVVGPPCYDCDATPFDTALPIAALLVPAVALWGDASPWPRRVALAAPVLGLLAGHADLPFPADRFEVGVLVLMGAFVAAFALAGWGDWRRLTA